MKVTEEFIRIYFKKLKTLEIQQERFFNEVSRIKTLRKIIEDCDIHLNTDLNSIDYSTDKVKTTNNKSYIERELDKAFNTHINTLSDSIKYKHLLKSSINNLKHDINNMNIIIKRLKEEDIKLLELIYYDDKSYRLIEEELSMSISNITKNKNRILRFIKSYNSNLKPVS